MWNEELKTYRVDMDRTERKQCKSKWFEDGGRDRISKSVDKGLKWQENAAEILTAVAALKN
ncbi:MarR family transcriptional regulator [Ahrensia sp. R2A130]|nr:MarR family transcriptional regulator [Ahrensia sp. R2A130]